MDCIIHTSIFNLILIQFVKNLCLCKILYKTSYFIWKVLDDGLRLSSYPGYFKKIFHPVSPIIQSKPID